MKLEEVLKSELRIGIERIYGEMPDDKLIQLQKTRKEFDGDLTFVVFPILRLSKKSPEITAQEIGDYLVSKLEEIDSYNVVKGFLNLCISEVYWMEAFKEALSTQNFGFQCASKNAEKIVIEYSSPNTNKPLHLGHIRNNLLGYSVASILKASGKEVKKVNLVNDRGIHICKSMLAWKKYGNGETPESTGKKGDHLVGDYYVKFDKEYKTQIKALMDGGISEEMAKNEAGLIKEAREMLLKWEAKDPEVYALWEKMNAWVYDGFEFTYKQMGVDFDKVYHESQTYLLGKDIVLDGLERGVFSKKEDGSIWCDLSADGLDEKLLLRADGTSVYMTQDIGTAILRFQDYGMDRMMYVVGNEQEYHFKVLALILQKLGYSWAENLYHLSYGMVELPEGKMKSREGTVVDADDLMKEMIDTARQMSEELGKLEEYSYEEKENIYRIIGLGALKYYILKVDPKKTMTFNPKESIDFNGNTGPFIQYTYARIRSLLKKAENEGIALDSLQINPVRTEKKEMDLIKSISNYPQFIDDAAKNYSPAIVANYIYELVKEYNQFYQEFPVLKEENETIKVFRLLLSKKVSELIRSGMELLGIEVPERM